MDSAHGSNVTMAETKDHELEFNPRAAVTDVQQYILRAAERSAAARMALKCELDLRYGEGPLAICDVFSGVGETKAVHVFVHGGYWRGRDKNDYSFVGHLLAKHGIKTIVINYDLCPAVTVEYIVSQISEFFRWLTTSLVGESVRITASGHSAGAHLIAMADIAEQAQGTKGLPLDYAVLISGLYDLRPVVNISVNESIGLTTESASQLSPALYECGLSIPADVVVGGAESTAWIAQSQSYSQQNNLVTGCSVLDEHNHYSIMELLFSESTWLSRLLITRGLGLNNNKELNGICSC